MVFAIAVVACTVAVGIAVTAFYLGRVTNEVERELVKRAEHSDMMANYWHREVCDQAEYLKKVKPILQEHGYLDYVTWKYGPDEDEGK